MKKFKTKEGIMLTKSEERKVKFKEGTVKLIPVWKFLLEKDNLKR